MNRPPVSVQLYSVRDALAADLEGTLRRLAELGFREVEPFGLPSHASELDRALAATGLRAPTCHAQLLGTDPTPALEAAAALGVEFIVEPAVEIERWSERDSVVGIARELGEVSRRAADLGLRVGYHNHWWETEQRIDGAPALAVLADALPDGVALEVDAYWAAVGGVDPVDLLTRLDGRVAAVHIKDGPLTRDTALQQPAGQGELPVAAILAAAPAARAILEFDDYSGDVFDGLGVGLQLLRELGARA